MGFIKNKYKFRAVFKDGEYPDDIFTKQATAWINDKKDEVINASDVLKTVMIINQCYEKNYVD